MTQKMDECKLVQIFEPLHLNEATAFEILFEQAKLNKIHSMYCDLYEELPFRPDMAFPPFQSLVLRKFQRGDGVRRKLIVVHGDFSCPGAPPARISRTTAARFLSISVCERLSLPAKFFK